LNAFFLCLSEILNGTDNSSFDREKLVLRDNAVNHFHLFFFLFLRKRETINKKNITQIAVAKKGKPHLNIAFV